MRRGDGPSVYHVQSQYSPQCLISIISPITDCTFLASIPPTSNFLSKLIFTIVALLRIFEFESRVAGHSPYNWLRALYISCKFHICFKIDWSFGIICVEWMISYIYKFLKCQIDHFTTVEGKKIFILNMVGHSVSLKVDSLLVGLIKAIDWLKLDWPIMVKGKLSFSRAFYEYGRFPKCDLILNRSYSRSNNGRGIYTCDLSKPYAFSKIPGFYFLGHTPGMVSPTI